MTAKVHLRTLPNGARLAVIDMPTHVGALRVTAVGSWFGDALSAAASVASRVIDDPIVKAIMPSQVTAAVDAVKYIANAAKHGGAPALNQALTQFSGPGKERLITTLKQEAQAQDAQSPVDAKPAKSSKADASSEPYRGIGPAPSKVGDMFDDAKRMLLARQGRRGANGVKDNRTGPARGTQYTPRRGATAPPRQAPNAPQDDTQDPGDGGAQYAPPPQYPPQYADPYAPAVPQPYPYPQFADDAYGDPYGGQDPYAYNDGADNGDDGDDAPPPIVRDHRS